MYFLKFVLGWVMDDDFAARLKELRENAGLTQGQLAEKAGLSKGGIANLEQGIREPSWGTVQALAAALGVDCLAFTSPPADAGKVPSPRGRPAKAAKRKSVPKKRKRKP
jgi:transcriptional regulator with XRE-family HTH domain